ncbi:MAG: hypothetical protein EBR02_03195 [Alphaproteobacteria bacterium]|nr:hypothetical protein [Alphaproteobacteria bacterium]
MMSHTNISVTIGISGAANNTESVQAMVAAVERAGAKPLLICDHTARNPERDAKDLHAIIFMGNDFDIAPESYVHRYPEGDARRNIHLQTRCELSAPESAARAIYENALMEIALKMRMPILGICGGMQRLNVICGGTLHQHVPDMVGDDRLMQNKTGICPREPVVPIVIPTDTRLAVIAQSIAMSFVKSGENCPLVLMENSLHHQSIDRLGDGLRVCSMSDVVPRGDGTTDYIIKGIEADPSGIYGEQFILGVQWHPEFGASPIGARITEHLVQHAKEFAIMKKT